MTAVTLLRVRVRRRCMNPAHIKFGSIACMWARKGSLRVTGVTFLTNAGSHPVLVLLFDLVSNRYCKEQQWNKTRIFKAAGASFQKIPVIMTNYCWALRRPTARTNPSVVGPSCNSRPKLGSNRNIQPKPPTTFDGQQNSSERPYLPQFVVF